MAYKWGRSMLTTYPRTGMIHTWVTQPQHNRSPPYYIPRRRGPNQPPRCCPPVPNSRSGCKALARLAKKLNWGSVCVWFVGCEKKMGELCFLRCADWNFWVGTLNQRKFTWNQQKMGDLFWQQLHFIDYEDKHLIGKHGLKGLLGMVEKVLVWTELDVMQIVMILY